MSDQPQGEAVPSYSVVVQYLKDLSFESPNAPKSLVPSEVRPEIEIGIDVQAQQMGQVEYEVVLTITGNAKRGSETVFVVECVYAAIVSLKDVPPELVEPVLFVESPRMIFPFARRIIGDATRDGGYPPLMLDPVDFVALYQRNRGQPAGRA